MGPDSKRCEGVRCLSCHAVYEPPERIPRHPGEGCPRCGDTAWLALRIPIGEPTRRLAS